MYEKKREMKADLTKIRVSEKDTERGEAQEPGEEMSWGRPLLRQKRKERHGFGCISSYFLFI